MEDSHTGRSPADGRGDIQLSCDHHPRRQMGPDNQEQSGIPHGLPTAWSSHCLDTSKGVRSCACF